MAASTQLVPTRSRYGYQPADGRSRRYDAPTACTASRYDAPTDGSTNRLDVPAARDTRFRAPSPRIGTVYVGPGARLTCETRT